MKIYIPYLLFGGGWITAGISLLIQPPNQWLFLTGLTIANIGGLWTVADWTDNLDIDTSNGDIRIKLSKRGDNHD